MTAQADADRLLKEAQERLLQLEEEEGDDELGDVIEIDPGEHFRGRFRGYGSMHTQARGLISVYLFWDSEGHPRFAYQRSKLVAEIEGLKPDVGDEVLILRGENREFVNKDGETQEQHRYAVRVRPCDDSLPGAEQQAPGQPALDEDVVHPDYGVPITFVSYSKLTGDQLAEQAKADIAHLEGEIQRREQLVEELLASEEP